MPIYESEQYTREDLSELRKKNVCSVCGEWLNIFLDTETGKAFLVCKDWLRTHHEGIIREASRYEQKGLESLNMLSRREAMGKQFGQEKTMALEKYHNTTALTKEQAKEILRTVFPDAPETEMVRAIMLCASYHLNPLMGHVFLIPFKGKDSKVSFATVIGIKAKRLLASRRGAFSYVDNTPRLMSEEEQKQIFGKVDENHLVAITVLRDPATGAEARGYGKWNKQSPIYGTDKGNSPENMAFIRSESQALDRLCPGEMPADIEVVDEHFVPLEEEPETKTPVVNGSVSEAKEETAKAPQGEVVYKTLKQLREKMTECNWSLTDVGRWCVAEPRRWKIKFLEDLTPEQINEIIQFMIRSPK